LEKADISKNVRRNAARIGEVKSECRVAVPTVMEGEYLQEIVEQSTPGGILA